MYSKFRFGNKRALSSDNIDTGVIFTTSTDPNYIGNVIRNTSGEIILNSVNSDSVSFVNQYPLEIGGSLHIVSTSSDASFDCIQNSGATSARVLRQSFNNTIGLRSDQGNQVTNNTSSYGNTLDVRFDRLSETNIDVYVSGVFAYTFVFPASQTFTFDMIPGGGLSGTCTFPEVTFTLGNGDVISFLFNETGNDPNVFSEPY